jgi:hypothetical protein
VRWIARPFLETGADFSLSPEHWIASETASQLTDGTPLNEIVLAVTKTQVPPEDARFVLDTGNAREGFLDVTILGNPVSGRTSAKKVAKDGDVIVSRLRPYLRQVTFIPPGTCNLLGVDQLYCSTEFFVLRPREEGRNISGLVAWLLSEPIQDMLGAAATGGHHPRIGLELLLNSPVEERYLGVEASERIGGVLRRHIEGQRELLVLLRH